MSKTSVAKDWLENFKEPLRVAMREQGIGPITDRLLREYLSRYKGAEWIEARAGMDEWLSEEAKAHPSENEQSGKC